jgi:hypothetical protein
VSLDNYLLQVWILKESCDQTEWVLKHENDLEPVIARYCPHQFRGFWMLKGIKHNSFCIHFPESKEDIAEEKFEWSSDRENVLENEDTSQDCSSEESYSTNDSDDVVDNEDAVGDKKKAILEEKFESNSNKEMAQECYPNEEDTCEIDMLGLHPFKEVLFLCQSAKIGLAYHLNSSKIDDLGDIYPKNYHRAGRYGLDMVKYAFAYTPCWIEEFPRNN